MTSDLERHLQSVGSDAEHDLFEQVWSLRELGFEVAELWRIYTGADPDLAGGSLDDDKATITLTHALGEQHHAANVKPMSDIIEREFILMLRSPVREHLGTVMRSGALALDAKEDRLSVELRFMPAAGNCRHRRGRPESESPSSALRGTREGGRARHHS